jgi:hypothetical protein
MADTGSAAAPFSGALRELAHRAGRWRWRKKAVTIGKTHCHDYLLPRLLIATTIALEVSHAPSSLS